MARNGLRLKDSTGTQAVTAQEQPFNTRSTEARFNHTRQDHSCRLCKHATEKVQHVVCGCKMQAGTTWHNQACEICAQEHMHLVRAGHSKTSIMVSLDKRHQKGE